MASSKAGNPAEDSSRETGKLPPAVRSPKPAQQNSGRQENLEKILDATTQIQDAVRRAETANVQKANYPNAINIIISDTANHASAILSAANKEKQEGEIAAAKLAVAKTALEQAARTPNQVAEHTKITKIGNSDMNDMYKGVRLEIVGVKDEIVRELARLFVNAAAATVAVANKAEADAEEEKTKKKEDKEKIKAMALKPVNWLKDRLSFDWRNEIAADKKFLTNISQPITIPIAWIWKRKAPIATGAVLGFAGGLFVPGIGWVAGPVLGATIGAMRNSQTEQTSHKSH